ncbi:blue copper protein 1a-like [Diospyros lotus]|uniref:blue copper protein 1a-like n=1 Tax=Diospyros lotus TaxID=55363 RepID=UPI002258A6D7|nr:blue copper protein 1a-like [Diospyros lotus]XP_052171528.1 blue copper protein 1a-like [Diospyros lotus]
MASSRILIAIAVLAMVVAPAFAVEHIVGDEKGWALNFDYQAWSEGKEFRVGDKLVFKYPEGAHDVLKVDGAAFQQCAAPATAEALTSGDDVIELATPGRKWYICGIGRHCEAGKMKLAITVLPERVESPASSPSGDEAPGPNSSSAASRIALPKYAAWMAGFFGIVFMIMV